MTEELDGGVPLTEQIAPTNYENVSIGEQILLTSSSDGVFYTVPEGYEFFIVSVAISGYVDASAGDTFGDAYLKVGENYVFGAHGYGINGVIYPSQNTTISYPIPLKCEELTTIDFEKSAKFTGEIFIFGTLLKKQII